MFRQLTLALVMLGSALQLAPAAPWAPCTITGDARDNVLRGKPDRDVICAKRGDDFANGRGSGDDVRGGRGNDTVVGGHGRDIIRGGKGADRLFGADDSGGDQLYGGPGFDRCFGDQGDAFRGCEVIFLA